MKGVLSMFSCKVQWSSLEIGAAIEENVPVKGCQLLLIKSFTWNSWQVIGVIEEDLLASVRPW